ncbi:hypothetical protein Lal_00015018 [Lupinus albus]|nr:hypothetical protein Lal_00015018 [Lupinus albus]
MSIVGPRPHAVAHNEQYRKLIKGYMLRHKVKPGITGWAQVNGLRGETATLDKMEARIQTTANEESVDHGCHRPGRFLSRRTAAGQGLRSAWHQAARFIVQYGSDRSHLPGPARRGQPFPPALRRPVGHVEPQPHHVRNPPGRGLQPRRDEPRGRVVRIAGIHGRRRCHRHVAPAGSDPLPRPGKDDAVLPGFDVGTLRPRAGNTAARNDAVLSAQPVRRREAVRLLDHGQLPRSVWDVRVQRHPVQPRIAAPRRDVRHAQDHARPREHLARIRATTLPRQPRRAARLGPCARLRRDAMADAAAGRARGLRHRDGPPVFRAAFRRGGRARAGHRDRVAGRGRARTGRHCRHPRRQGARGRGGPADRRRRSAVFPSDGSGHAARRPGQGAPPARLGAPDLFRSDGAGNGGARPRDSAPPHAARIAWLQRSHEHRHAQSRGARTDGPGPGPRVLPQRAHRPGLPGRRQSGRHPREQHVSGRVHLRQHDGAGERRARSVAQRGRKIAVPRLVVHLSAPGPAADQGRVFDERHAGADERAVCDGKDCRHQIVRKLQPPPRDPGADAALPRSEAGRRARGRDLGQRQADARIPVRGRYGPGVRVRDEPRPRDVCGGHRPDAFAHQRGHRRGRHDRRPGPPRGRRRRLPRPHRVRYGQAGRHAAQAARRLQAEIARLAGEDAVARRIAQRVCGLRRTDGRRGKAGRRLNGVAGPVRQSVN